MSVVKQVVGTRTALTVTGLGTLASGTYVASSGWLVLALYALDAT